MLPSPRPALLVDIAPSVTYFDRDFGTSNTFEWSCPGSGRFFVRLVVNCIPSVASDFGSAHVDGHVGPISVEGYCSGAVSVSIGQKVMLTTSAQLSETQVRMATMFPAQLQQQIAALPALQLLSTSQQEGQARAAAMFGPANVEVHCLPSTDATGQCRVGITGLSPVTAGTNSAEVQAQLQTIFSAVQPITVQPVDTIVTSELVLSAQDLDCTDANSECHARLASMFTTRQPPQVAFVSEFVAAPADQSMSVRMQVRALDEDQGNAHIDRVRRCVAQPAPVTSLFLVGRPHCPGNIVE